jgi:hypothetical protein
MRRSLLFLILPVALLAAACGGGDAISIEDVAAAADKTTEQGSSRFSFTTKISGAGGRTIEMSGGGLMDYRTERARIEVDMSGLLEAAGGSGDLTTEMLLAGRDFYLRMPRQVLEEAGVPASKPWIKVNLEQATGVNLSELQQGVQSPADQLQMLRAVSDEWERKGEEEVRGTRTTRFHVVVDAQKATREGLKNVPERYREQAKRAIEQFTKDAGLDEIPMDVWLDDDGVLRRLEMNVNVASEGEQIAMQMRTELYDFGVEVDIKPPPASQVTDVTQEAMQGG